MKKENEIKVSVRNLVEFVLRSGDLDTRFLGSSRAVDGTRIHQKIQKLKKEEYLGKGLEYIPEVTLSHTMEYENMQLVIEGRADAVIKELDGFVIDEIKTVTKNLELIDENYNLLHWAQAKCYGYIYAVQNSLNYIDIQLTYCQLDTEDIKYFKKRFSVDELKAFFLDIIDKYYFWANITRSWNAERDASIKELPFPFEKYRKGQRELAVAVYKTITEGKKIFAQAPTGIGKTISTLFPAVKAMREGNITKIFYLTAKTITRQVAEEALSKMKQKGLKLKSITLTAKDKICFNKGRSCNPEQCEYAKGHFDRVNEAIFQILNYKMDITREVIEDYAKQFRICPFEFSLDLSLWCDCIICDYNYVFDPRVYLKRFFMESREDYAFLIDESHNLVDRAREMFSAELYKRTFLDLKKLMKEKDKRIYKALNKLNTYMLEMKKLCLDKESYVCDEEPKNIYPLLQKFINESEEWLVKNEGAEGHDKLLELYFNSLTFMKIAEFYDSRYITYIENGKDDVKLKVFCLDPSHLLKEAVKRGKSAVFFSATLTPLNYFKEILGGSEEDYTLRLNSPFQEENLCLMAADRISTKYKNRENSYEVIVSYIKEVISSRKGNYMIFFPSYKYMNDVAELYKAKYPEVNVSVQAAIMNEDEREEFLERFRPEPDETFVAFAVLGGIFSEGIDLKGDRLSGAVIIGVGLPQMCLERDIISEYFTEKNSLGYEYSYMYPGMNKVLQASGRVIRSEKDTGIVLLIDERFTSPAYLRLFPNEWRHYLKVTSPKQIKETLSRFWR